MKKRSLILLVGAIAIATAAGFITRSSWMGGSSNAQGPQRPRMVSVELAKAERKSMPVDVDAIGMVTPISSVALKSRLETTIVSVHFEDGAKVNEGDLLFMPIADASISLEENTKIAAKQNAVLMSFPEVECAVAKVARADTSTDPARVCFVDWEMAGVGCGLLDLVHLAHGLSGPDADGMQTAYFAELDGTVLACGADQRRRLLAACALQNTLYRLAHIRAWSVDTEAVERWVDEVGQLSMAV